jgi:hypothetical protein
MFETDTRTQSGVLSVGTINEANAGESLSLQNVTKWERVLNTGFSDLSVLTASAFAVDFSSNVGPEFLHHDSKRVVSDLRPPYTGGIAQGLLV